MSKWDHESQAPVRYNRNHAEQYAPTRQAALFRYVSHPSDGKPKISFVFSPNSPVFSPNFPHVFPAQLLDAALKPGMLYASSMTHPGTLAARRYIRGGGSVGLRGGGGEGGGGFMDNMRGF